MILIYASWLAECKLVVHPPPLSWYMLAFAVVVNFRTLDTSFPTATGIFTLAYFAIERISGEACSFWVVTGNNPSLFFFQPKFKGYLANLLQCWTCRYAQRGCSRPAAEVADRKAKLMLFFFKRWNLKESNVYSPFLPTYKVIKMCVISTNNFIVEIVLNFCSTVVSRTSTNFFFPCVKCADVVLQPLSRTEKIQCCLLCVEKRSKLLDNINFICFTSSRFQVKNVVRTSVCCLYYQKADIFPNCHNTLWSVFHFSKNF